MKPTQSTPDQPSPTLTPQPNRIIAEPATVAACQRDYTQGAEVRATLATQEARQR